MSESRASYWDFALRYAIWVFYILLSSNSCASSSVLTDDKNQNKDRNCVTDVLQNVNMNLMRQLVNQETLIRVSMSKTITDMTNDFAVIRKTLTETQTDMAAIKEENKRLKEEVSKNKIDIADHNATFEETRTRQDTLMKKVNAHTENIEALSVENKAFKEQISENKEGLADIHNNMTDGSAQMVAFTVRLSGSYSKIHSIIIPSAIVTNIGSGYNVATGIFICPVKGLYSFNVHLSSNSKRNGIWIYKNNQQMTLAYFNKGSFDIGGSASLVTYLDVGDRITLRSYSSNLYLDSSSNFSGMKIQ